MNRENVREKGKRDKDEKKEEERNKTAIPYRRQETNLTSVSARILRLRVLELQRPNVSVRRMLHGKPVVARVSGKSRCENVPVAPPYPGNLPEGRETRIMVISHFF